MKKAIRKLGIGSLLALSAIVPASAQQAPSADSVILLDQAWSKEDREWYYNFSQGSAVISYDLFLNMEAADSQDLFRNGLNGPRYGLVPQPVSPSNPDGLPIGVSKTNVATADQGLAGRRLRRHDLCGVPPRAAEVQRQAHSDRRRHLKHVRFPGSGFRHQRSASKKPDRRGKIRPFGVAAQSNDSGCEGQVAQAN